MLAAALLLVAAAGCNESANEPVEGASPDPSFQRLEKGWMGGFGRKDEALAKLLGSSKGWPLYRDMNLFEAVRVFSADGDGAGKLGAARAHLEFARLFEGLDGYYVETEYQYFAGQVDRLSPAQRIRFGFLALRAGALELAGELFANPVEGFEAEQRIGLAGISALSGNEQEALKTLGAIDPEKLSPEATALLRVSAHVWGLTSGLKGGGGFGQSLDALAAGDFFGAVVPLQMLDLSQSRNGPEADIYLYKLLSELFASMAAEAVSGLETPDADFLAGQALMYRGDFNGAANRFERAGKGDGAVSDTVLIYSPYSGAEELREQALVLRALAIYLGGQTGSAENLFKEASASVESEVAKAWIAAIQTQFSLIGPYEDAAAAADGAIKETALMKVRASNLEGSSTISMLLATRQAEVMMAGAIVAAHRGDTELALDRMNEAHLKRLGNKPSFINPPGFMTALSRAYKHSGQYAPAVEILFELSRQYPTSRLAYESLKRLYASTTGGEAPPR